MSASKFPHPVQHKVWRYLTLDKQSVERSEALADLVNEGWFGDFGSDAAAEARLIELIDGSRYCRPGRDKFKEAVLSKKQGATVRVTFDLGIENTDRTYPYLAGKKAGSDAFDGAVERRLKELIGTGLEGTSKLRTIDKITNVSTEVVKANGPID